MPEEGVTLQPASNILSDAEVVTLANQFIDRGVSKIRFTGGEPLIRPGILDICKDIKIKHMAITTNGILLRRKLVPLFESGVNLLNISLDTLVPSKFELITRRRGFDRVFNSIVEACEMPFEQVKVNCVVKRGVNEDEILDFVELTQHMNIQVRFIEYMPFDGNKWNSKSMISYHEMVDMIRAKWPEFHRCKDEQHAVSKAWKVPGFTGSIGFISSMSDHFCGTCNRMRITADGNLKACLFGNDEVSLRDALRSGVSDLDEIIQNTVMKKHEKLGGHESPESIADGVNRPMILIGG